MAYYNNLSGITKNTFMIGKGGPLISNSSGIAVRNNDDSAYVGFTAESLNAGAGLVGTPSITFYGDSDTGLYSVGANQLGITAGGALVATLQAPGSANASVVFNGTAAITLPSGNTSQQPSSAVNGMIRYNSQTNKFEAYENSAWTNMIGGGGGTPGGSDTQLQWNNAGTFDGTSNLTWDSTNSYLVLGTGAAIRGLDGGTAGADVTLIGGNGTTTPGNIVLNPGFLTGTPSTGGVINGIDNGGASRTLFDASMNIPVGRLNSGTNASVTTFWNGSTAWLTAVTSVNLTAPAAGITVSGGPITTSGSITLALANDLAGLEGLSGTGFAARTATDTWANRTITGTANQITVTNGAGVAGDPTLAIANNAVLPGTGAVTVPASTSANQPSPVNGMIRYDTDTNRLRAVVNGTWTDLAGGTIPNLFSTFTDGTTAVTSASTSGTFTFVDGAGINFVTDNTAKSLTASLTTAGLSDTAVATGDLVPFFDVSNVNTPEYRSLANIFSDLNVVNGITTNGVIVRTAAGTYTSRTITGTANQISVANGDGVAGAPTIGLVANTVIPGTGAITIPASGTANQPAATNGMLRYDTDTNKLRAVIAGTWTDLSSTTGTVTSVNITAPAAGITASGGPITTTGSITLALANDLAAVEGLSTNGIAVRTATDTWTTRTITGTANQITVTNGDGVSGAPTLAIASNAVLPGTGAITIPASTSANQPAATNGMIRYDTDTNQLRAVVNGTWVNVVSGTIDRTQITDSAQTTVRTTEVAGTVTVNANDAGTTRRIANFLVGATGANAAAVDFNSKQNRIDLIASGAGTNIDMYISPKGTGTLFIGNGTSAETIQAAGVAGMTIRGGASASGTAAGAVNIIGGVNSSSGNGGNTVIRGGSSTSGTQGLTLIQNAAGTEVVRVGGVAGTDNAFKVTGGAVGVPVALTDAATITPDMNAANNFTLTIGGNRTLANPTNLVAGQSGVIVITQDATGSRTLSFGSAWKFSGGTAPTLTTTANAVDILAYYVESGTRITAKIILDTR